jgi:hypothetical protein
MAEIDPLAPPSPSTVATCSTCGYSWVHGTLRAWHSCSARLLAENRQFQADLEERERLGSESIARTARLYALIARQREWIGGIPFPSPQAILADVDGKAADSWLGDMVTRSHNEGFERALAKIRELQAFCDRWQDKRSGCEADIRQDESDRVAAEYRGAGLQAAERHEQEKVAAREEGRREGLREAGDGGVAMIAAERRRQVEVEGWTAGHDDQHRKGEMALAAMCYAHPPYPARPAALSLFWPWDMAWWKAGERLRELSKAGALIAAEIDRLLRSARPEGGALMERRRAIEEIRDVWLQNRTADGREREDLKRRSA